ncbi:TetR/AcrR family transcriptional regulator [Winogradskyella sp.]|uniref:TetR/AcrR family transcriptional regulator n=1 Tax=Winogradskyella sp. TaxID=1883156 RepID=UPI003511F473
MKNEYTKTGRINQKKETRSNILVSTQYFLNKGQGFTLEDVAKKTKISRATIYRYFSNVDILAAEAALDIRVKNPKDIVDSLDGNSWDDKVFAIQEYFNILAIDNENAFRKYLSTVLDSSTSKIKRGARRKKALQLALEETDFTPKEKNDLSNVFTILMGIEPLIVGKDVCGLNNAQTNELLKWGITLMIRGLNSSGNIF